VPRRVLSVLGSLWLTLVLLVLFAAAIAVATIMEGSLGTPGAKALVYNARWFEGVLALLTLNLLVTLGRSIPFRPHRLGFILVHIAMIVILVGAGVTRYFGYEGTMHIREGDVADTMLSREDHVRIAVDGEHASFPVRLFRAGSQSLARDLAFGAHRVRVSVTEFWPHYEAANRPIHDDQPALRFAVNANGASTVSLRPGRERVVDGIRLAWMENTLLSSVGEPPLGSLEVRVDGATGSLPVTEDLPASVEAGGFRFTITEFRADFTVGGQPDASPRMTNPMIRVSVAAPDDETEERMLFAYHPEFAEQHGGSEGAFATVEADYRFERRLLFAGAGDSLVARCTLPLAAMDESAGQDAHHVIPPGREFGVTPLTVYRTPKGDFSIVLQADAGAGGGNGATGDSEAPPAARIQVENEAGESVTAVLIRGRGSASRVLGDREISLAFGSTRVALPYSLHLDDFVLLTYPGSNKPSGFESHVRLFDPESGIDGRATVIRMNNPLTHRGFKFFQSSYDDDNRGTILTVNYDPGKWPTYVGYTLISLGFLLSLLKNLIWSPRRGQPYSGGIA
jgi:hypothetical protein